MDGRPGRGDIGEQVFLNGGEGRPICVSIDLVFCHRMNRGRAFRVELGRWDCQILRTGYLRDFEYSEGFGIYEALPLDL